MDFFNKPASAPNLNSYTPTSVNSALGQYLGQQSQLPQLQQFATAQNQGANTAYQNMLFGTSPTLQQNLSQFGQNTQSLLNGQIPADVAAQTQNNAAFQALQGGFGGSNMAHALTARDLGQTSLSLQQQGAQNLNQQTQLSAALNPSNVMTSSMFYSPQTILSRDDQSNLINQQIGAQNQQIDYQNSLQRSPFDQLMTNNLATMMGIATNPLDAYAAMEGGGQQMVSNQGQLSQQPSSGGSGGGGGMGGIMSALGPMACCFIFLESYNGTLPWWVRECRDEFAPESTSRRIGYIRMSKWLVPAMRVSKVARFLTNILMVNPLTKWGGFYKGVKGYENGWVYKPFVNAWFAMWYLLGKSEDK